MKALPAENVEYLALHGTAGNEDATKDDLYQWFTSPPPHGRGWSDHGYQGYFWQDGRFENGRAVWHQGAHIQGMNHNTLGYALVGNYDDLVPSAAMLARVAEVFATLCHTYNVPVSKVIGHREGYDIMGQERRKTCPGKNVDMDHVRRLVDAHPALKSRPDLRLPRSASA